MNVATRPLMCDTELSVHKYNKMDNFQAILGWLAGLNYICYLTTNHSWVTFIVRMFSPSADHSDVTAYVRPANKLTSKQSSEIFPDANGSLVITFLYSK